MPDQRPAPESGKGSPILPPEIFEQRGSEILFTTAVREPARREPIQIPAPKQKPPKQKSKSHALLGLLIVILAAILVFFFFRDPVKNWLNKPTGGPAMVAPEVSSSALIPPMKPRVSAPVPSDAEIDAAPVPPARNDLRANSTQV